MRKEKKSKKEGQFVAPSPQIFDMEVEELEIENSHGFY
jgi:hypothetical protein